MAGHQATPRIGDWLAATQAFSVRARAWSCRRVAAACDSKAAAASFGLELPPPPPGSVTDSARQLRCSSPPALASSTTTLPLAPLPSSGKQVSARPPPPSPNFPFYTFGGEVCAVAIRWVLRGAVLPQPRAAEPAFGRHSFSALGAAESRLRSCPRAHVAGLPDGLYNRYAGLEDGVGGAVDDAEKGAGDYSWLSSERLLELMAGDKKAAGGRVRTYLACSCRPALATLHGLVCVRFSMTWPSLCCEIRAELTRSPASISGCSMPA